MKIHLLTTQEGGREKGAFFAPKLRETLHAEEKKGRGEKREGRSGGSQKGGRSRKYFFPFHTRLGCQIQGVCKTVKKKKPLYRLPCPHLQMV